MVIAPQGQKSNIPYFSSNTAWSPVLYSVSNRYLYHLANLIWSCSAHVLPNIHEVPPGWYFRSSLCTIALSLSPMSNPADSSCYKLTQLWSLLLISEEMLYSAPTLASCKGVGNCSNCEQVRGTPQEFIPVRDKLSYAVCCLLPKNVCLRYCIQFYTCL